MKLGLRSPNCPQNLSNGSTPTVVRGVLDRNSGGCGWEGVEPGVRAPPRRKVGRQASRGQHSRGEKTEMKAKTNQKKPRNSFYAKTSVTGRVSAVAPCRQSSELPSQNVREESNSGDCPRVSADSFVTGAATSSLFDSRREDADTAGTVPPEAAPLATAALPRAPRLLLKHIDGVLVLHLQLCRGVCFINRLPIKSESNLSH